MSIWKSLFSSSEGIEKLADGAYNGIDAAVYTQEEKIEHRLQALKLYEPFKVAQRFLALIFAIPYSLAWGATFIASFLVDDVTAQTQLLTGTHGQIVLAIVAFYFMGGVVNGIPFNRGKK